jgi:hypothetical protein
MVGNFVVSILVLFLFGVHLEREHLTACFFSYIYVFPLLQVGVNVGALTSVDTVMPPTRSKL